MTFICSELFCSSYHYKIVTVSNKYCALTRCNINFTVLCVINVDIGSYVKDKILTVITGIDIVLLTLYWIDFFNFKLVCLIFKLVVIRIVFLFYSLWLENIRIGFFLFYFRGLNFLNGHRLCLQILILLIHRFILLRDDVLLGFKYFFNQGTGLVNFFGRSKLLLHV